MPAYEVSEHKHNISTEEEEVMNYLAREIAERSLGTGTYTTSIASRDSGAPEDENF